MKTKRLIVLSAALFTAAIPANAHHSYAMFDGTKQVDIEGTVKEFQWTNPHCWIQVTVPDGKGGESEYSIEAVAVSGMRNQGWTRNSLKPGDKIKVSMRPLRNGMKGGSLMSVTLEDGRKLAVGDAPTIGKPAETTG